MIAFVIAQGDAGRPPGDRHAVEGCGDDPAAHPGRILDDDAIPAAARPNGRFEAWPAPGYARIDDKVLAFAAQAEKALQAGAMQPGG